MCIGDELGRTVVFLFTAAVLQSLRLSLAPDCHYDRNRRPNSASPRVPRPSASS